MLTKSENMHKLFIGSIGFIIFGHIACNNRLHKFRLVNIVVRISHLVSYSLVFDFVFNYTIVICIINQNHSINIRFPSGDNFPAFSLKLNNSNESKQLY